MYNYIFFKAPFRTKEHLLAMDNHGRVEVRWTIAHDYFQAEVGDLMLIQPDADIFLALRLRFESSF